MFANNYLLTDFVCSPLLLAVDHHVTLRDFTNISFLIELLWFQKLCNSFTGVCNSFRVSGRSCNYLKYSIFLNHFILLLHFIIHKIFPKILFFLLAPHTKTINFCIIWCSSIVANTIVSIILKSVYIFKLEFQFDSTSMLFWTDY